MLHRLSNGEIKELCSKQFATISNRDREEMAIPSYLHGNPLVRWLVWQRHHKIDRMGRFKEHMSVLDFGCGIGVFLPTLCRQVGTVYACDLFPEYAKELSKNKGLDVGFIDTIDDLENESLDAIIAAEVLEHIDDLGQLINDFRAKLKPACWLIVSAPTEGFAYKLGRFIAGFSSKHDYHKLNSRSLSAIIEGCDFCLVEKETLPFSIPPYLYEVFVFRKLQ